MSKGEEVARNYHSKGGVVYAFFPYSGDDEKTFSPAEFRVNGFTEDGGLVVSVDTLGVSNSISPSVIAAVTILVRESFRGKRNCG